MDLGVPVVDLFPLKESAAPEESWSTVAGQFQSALKARGFTYIINHGIPAELVDQAFQISRGFFHLPTEVKEKYVSEPKRFYHGYNRRKVKLEDQVNCDVRECFDCAGNDRIYPKEVDDFGRVLERLEEKSKQLICVLLRLLAKSLNIDDSYFLEASKYLVDPEVISCSNLRTLYYPPIPENVELPASAVRTNEHTDYGLITLLFQDSIGGLQVKIIDGCWTPVAPLKDAILINTGDLLEFWTGGLIPATPHRVLIPSDKVKRNSARQSIAYFIQPDQDFVISPIPSDSIQYASPFVSIKAVDYVTQKLNLVY